MQIKHLLKALEGLTRQGEEEEITELMGKPKSMSITIIEKPKELEEEAETESCPHCLGAGCEMCEENYPPRGDLEMDEESY
jgi:hypothetical protein